MTHLLAVFDQTVRALDEALLLAKHKNGTQENVIRCLHGGCRRRAASRSCAGTGRSCCPAGSPRCSGTSRSRVRGAPRGCRRSRGARGYAGWQRLGSITKADDAYLRCLLVNGARAVIANLREKQDRFSRWVRSLVERRGYWRAAVTIAAKNARMAWAVLKYGDDFKHEPAAAWAPPMCSSTAHQKATVS